MAIGTLRKAFILSLRRVVIGRAQVPVLCVGVSEPLSGELADYEFAFRNRMELDAMDEAVYPNVAFE